jgi:PKD repeat protein
MGDLNRRRLLEMGGAAAGLGIGAQPISGRIDQQGNSNDSSVMATFNGTIQDGFLMFDALNPEATESSLKLDFGELRRPITVEGEVYEDKTWASTNLNFPEFAPSALIDTDDLPDSIEDVNFCDRTSKIENSTLGMSGTYDPYEGLVTGDTIIEIDFVLEFDLVLATSSDDVETNSPCSNPDISLDFRIRLNSAKPIELTSGESDGSTTPFELEGSTANLNKRGTSVTLVNNTYTVPRATGQIEIIGGSDVNELLELPYDHSGENWLELGMDIQWDGNGPRFPPAALPGRDNPPTDVDGDGLYEDVRRDGEVDIFDVQALFTNMDTDAVQDHSWAFNFMEEESDEVTVMDVQALFNRL